MHRPHDSGNKKRAQGALFMATRIVARRAPGTAGTSVGPPTPRSTPLDGRLSQELGRIDDYAIRPDLEVNVRPGGAAGGSRLRHLLATAHQVADLHQQP